MEERRIKELQKEIIKRREDGTNIKMIIGKDGKTNIYTEVNIGERLRDLRKNNKFTQEDLADELGITRSAVNGWEMGLSLPSTQYLIKLSILFKVSVDYLLGLNNSETINISNLKQSDKEIIYDLLKRFNTK